MELHMLKLMLSIILIGFITCCERLDQMNYEFDNYEEVKQSGLISKGWIPEFLPVSSQKIREQHNLDTNDVWLSFLLLNKNEIPCRRVESSQVIFPRRIKWWPTGLSRESLDQHNFSFFHCENNAYMASDKHSNLVFYWRKGY